MARSKVMHVLRAPVRVWWGSLPLRVVVSTLGCSLLILVIGGVLLVRQASNGILEAKRVTSLSEAQAALTRMQQDLRVGADLRTTSVNERLNQLAGSSGGAGSSYLVMIEGPVSNLVSPGLASDSVPRDLRDAVFGGEGTWIVPTEVVYSDGRVPEPGLAIGSNLYAPISGERFPVYLVFPATNEVATLKVLQQAVISTGAGLTLALALVAYLVSLQVVQPIRRASIAARRLASGQLDERLQVRGTDDIASLATSMNNMASELQRQIVQLEALSKLQQRFVSDVSHELRTPLTTVRMAAEMLYDNRETLQGDARRSTELMHTELDRFEALLTDLLEVSRFDAGAATLTLEEIDLADLVLREVDSQRSFASRQGVELVLHADEPALAEVDPRRVQRIVRNLITNAIEHGERQPVHITIAGSEDAVAVTVRDFGVGFEGSQAGKVFDRFWRADPSRSRAVGGTGLGLSISLEDARLHQGWLSAWGRPGLGAQFRLTLPRRHGDKLRSSPLPVVPAALPTPVEKEDA